MPGCSPCGTRTGSGPAARASRRAGWRPSRAPGQPWTPTLPTLALLHDFGLDPDSAAARETVALVRANCRWEYDGQPFFDGEVEPCINGRTVALGAYFGEDVDGIVDAAAGRAARGRRLELRGGERLGPLVVRLHDQRAGGTARARAGHRRHRADPWRPGGAARSTCSNGRCSGAGAPARSVSPGYLQFSFPPRWHYDVLRALDYFRAAGDAPDERIGGGGRAGARASGSRTARGCWRTPTRARCTSRSRTATAGPAAGTRCARCACCAGTTGPG